MSIHTVTNKRDRLEVLDRYLLLGDKAKTYTIGNSAFTAYTVAEINSTYDDTVTIQQVTHTSSTQKYRQWKPYVVYYGDDSADQLFPKDDYVLLPMVIPVSTTYVDSDGKRVLMQRTLQVSIPVNYATARRINNYMSGVDTTDFELMVTDFVQSPDVYGYDPGEWGRRMYLRYVGRYGAHPQYWTWMYGGLRRHNSSWSDVSRTKWSTLGEEGLTIEVQTLDRSEDSYWEMVFNTTDIQGKTLDIRITQDTDSTMVGSSRSYTGYTDDTGREYGDTGVAGEIRFSRVIDRDRLVMRIYYNVEAMQIGIIAIIAQEEFSNVSLGKITCSQYKWYRDNNFPTQSTPIMATRGYEAYVEDGVMYHYELVGYGFAPSMQILNKDDTPWTGNTSSDWYGSHTYNGIDCTITNGRKYDDDSGYTPELGVYHQRGIDWIIDRYEYIRDTLPVVEEESRYGASRLKYSVKKVSGEVVTGSMTKASNVKASTADTVPVQTQWFVKVDDTPVEADTTEISKILEDWDSGYSSLEEMNALVMVQNGLEEQRLAMEKVLVEQAQALEKLDVFRLNADSARKGYTKWLDKEVNISIAFSSNKVWEGTGGNATFRMTRRKAAEGGWIYTDKLADEQKLVDAYNKADSEKGAAAAIQEAYHNDYYELLQKYSTEEMKGMAKDVLSTMTPEMEAKMNSGMVKVETKEQYLDNWFKGRVQEALRDGQKLTDRSGALGYETTTKDGYAINVNEGLIGTRGGQHTEQYVQYHESRHLYQDYFTPLSGDAYGYSTGGYNTSGNNSTQWAENEANIYAGYKMGMLGDNWDGKYIAGRKVLGNDYDKNKELLGRIKTEARVGRPLFDSEQRLDKVEGVLESEYDATMRRLQMLRRRKKRQWNRGR